MSMESLVNHYDVFCDNSATENELNDDKHSSASNFSCQLLPFLDLAPLLYLRSVAAEVQLSRLHIGSFPLSFSRLESCQLFLYVPPSFADANQLVSSKDVEKFNGTPFQLPMADRTCPNSEDVIEFMNLTFRHHLSYFIICRFINICCDEDYLDEHSRFIFSKQDITLLLRYLDTCLFTRLTLHNYLCNDILGITEPLQSQITYSKVRGIFTGVFEAEVLKDSKVFKNPAIF